jgi:hypothetical protein
MNPNNPNTFTTNPNQPAATFNNYAGMAFPTGINPNQPGVTQSSTAGSGAAGVSSNLLNQILQGTQQSVANPNQPGQMMTASPYTAKGGSGYNPTSSLAPGGPYPTPMVGPNSITGNPAGTQPMGAYDAPGTSYMPGTPLQGLGAK